MKSVYADYYSGPERRVSPAPRRNKDKRRHRLRREALVSDCRLLSSRRSEDEEGFIEVSSLDADETTQKANLLDSSPD